MNGDETRPLLTDSNDLAGKDVTHRKDEQDNQKEKARRDENVREPTAVTDVHKIENNQGRFDYGNRKGHHIIENAEILECDPDGDAGQNDESHKNCEINPLGDNMLRH